MTGPKPTTLWWAKGCPDHLATDLAARRFTSVGPRLDERSAASVLFAGGESYDSSVLDELPDVKMVARTGIGYDAIDLDAATERGVMVTNTPDGPTTSTAEHTIALMMAVAHELKPSAARLRAATGDYVNHQRSMELKGRTLGLLGYGRIGKAVAEMAGAIGMRILISDPAYDGSVELDELFAESDVLSIHAPATPSTVGLIDADVFAKMKPGSILVNCARGPIVVTDDLVAALESGHLMGAGLDVTDPEPLAPDHPLLHMQNVIATPHIASNTMAGRARMESMAFEQASMALAGTTPTELLNPEVLKHPRWSKQ